MRHEARESLDMNSRTVMRSIEAITFFIRFLVLLFVINDSYIVKGMVLVYFVLVTKK